MSPTSIAIRIANADALRFKADILILKYAQNLYGVDKAAYNSFKIAGSNITLPARGEHQFEPAYHILGVDRVLFIGVEPISDFGYGEIRDFGRRAMTILGTERPKTRHVALTVHGVGFGLDENESFEAELAGVIEAITQNEYPESLEEITFVENNESRSARLTLVLEKLMPTGKLDRINRGPLGGLDVPAKQTLRTAGYASASKPRVFVAMPFADEMSDTFHYGIQGAVNAAGLLAERADLESFTGDVLDWVQNRISNSKLVIADLTSSNPNVYLEVGYAWGKGVPTVLINRTGTVLKFDVRGQRCIAYSSIKDLESKLTNELVALQAGRI